MASCPYCHYDVPRGERYCPFCRAAVPDKISPIKLRSRSAVLVFVLIIILMILIFSMLYTSITAPNPQDWWVEYPDYHNESTEEVDHPDWIIDELDEYDVVVLFFWQVGCGPC